MNQIDPDSSIRGIMETGEVELKFSMPTTIPALGYKVFRVGPAWKPKNGRSGDGLVHGYEDANQDPSGKEYFHRADQLACKHQRENYRVHHQAS